MELNDAGKKVLSDILSIGADRKLAIGVRPRVPTPDAEDLYALCNLLGSSPREEDLQLFLEQRPGFIAGLLGGPDNADLALLFKPAIGTQYFADFCVLQAHQGGCVVQIFEIESSHEPLFTKSGRIARRLSGAMKQIDDWQIWINGAHVHLGRELIREAKSVPMFPKYKSSDRGFRLRESDEIEEIWNAFGGNENPVYNFSIIIGRWSKLDDSQKARVLNINRQRKETCRLYTYEQLARGANFRLERDDWFNESDD